MKNFVVTIGREFGSGGREIGEALAEKLGCPVIETISTVNNNQGLKDVVEKAVSLVGKGQKATYVQEDIDLQDKAAVEMADRKRFEFVNGIVKAVESRKVFTNQKNTGDRIDEILFSGKEGC